MHHLQRCIVRPSLRALHSATWPRIAEIPLLADDSIETFRHHAFQPEKPALLPRGHFLSLPAASSWFKQPSSSRSSSTGPPAPPQLNTAHLSPSGELVVPLEITTPSDDDGTAPAHFTRVDQPLTAFLTYTAHLQSDPSAAPPTRIYLAQCALSALDARLRADLPTPPHVARAGRGDVYAAAVWLGAAPTRTPLHRDPNPNLFVQLAGRKVVRMLEPRWGEAVWREARRRAGAGAEGRGRVRGPEMMGGVEAEALEDLVWGVGLEDVEGVVLWEAVVEAGDGLFVPTGWWHSVKGVGEGMVGSVNWWFR